MHKNIYACMCIFITCMNIYCCCCCLVAKLWLILWDPMGCNLPGSSFHGISQARILEWVAISFSRGSFWPRDLNLCGLMLKLKLQYFGHLMRRTDSLEKTLMLGKTEGGRRRGRQRMRRLDGITIMTQWTWVWANSRTGKWRTGKPGVLQFIGSQRIRLDWVTE